MFKLVHKRGTTAQHAGYTGALSEATYDSDKKTLVIHDGVTPGGNPLATEADVTAQLADITDRKLDSALIEPGEIFFEDFEQGLISGVNGLDVVDSKYIRNSEYHRYTTLLSLIVTPETGYKCAGRAYTKSGEIYTFAVSYASSALPFTITINPDYYYRFVIVLDPLSGSGVAEWAQHVKFETVPIYTYTDVVAVMVDVVDAFTIDAEAWEE